MHSTAPSPMRQRRFATTRRKNGMSRNAKARSTQWCRFHPHPRTERQLKRTSTTAPCWGKTKAWPVCAATSGPLQPHRVAGMWRQTVYSFRRSGRISGINSLSTTHCSVKQSKAVFGSVLTAHSFTATHSTAVTHTHTHSGPNS